MSALVGPIDRDDDDVADAGPDHVIAPGAAVGLASLDRMDAPYHCEQARQGVVREMAGARLQGSAGRAALPAASRLHARQYRAQSWGGLAPGAHRLARLPDGADPVRTPTGSAPSGGARSRRRRIEWS
jgi:hypothetical protein